MAREIPKTSETSAHFRANLGVLEETAAQIFSNWAETNCSHHVTREEDGSIVLYATRKNSRSEQQNKNTLRALASNKNIKLKTEAAFLQLLRPEEYDEVIAREATAATSQTDAPGLRDAVPPTCCKMEVITIASLPDGIDERARERGQQHNVSCRAERS